MDEVTAARFGRPVLIDGAEYVAAEATFMAELGALSGEGTHLDTPDCVQPTVQARQKAGRALAGTGFYCHPLAARQRKVPDFTGVKHVSEGAGECHS